MSLRDFYDLKYINRASETIPPYAVMQVNGAEDVGGLSFLKVVKPNDNGTIYILNGPRACAVGEPSSATSALAHLGAFALFNDANTPAVNEQWGPESGSWRLKKDGVGFFVIGDEKGAAGSQPGFPSTPSTKRVRVSGAGGGGGGAASGNLAMIVQTVAPINHFDSGSTSIIPSFAGGAAILLVPTPADNALGFTLELETTPDTEDPEIRVLVIRTAINLSRSTFRASSAVPIIMPGYTISVEGGEGPGPFVIGNWDMASMQGFEKGSHSPEAPFMQIPFHLGGTYDFGLGGQPCPPPEIEIP